MTDPRPLGDIPEELLSTGDLALRFDVSAGWLLRGEVSATPLVGVGAYLAVATRLRAQEATLATLRAELDAARGALQPFVRATLTDNGHIIGLMREDFERAAAVLTPAPNVPPEAPQ